MKRNLTLELRGLDEKYFDSIESTLNLYVLKLNPDAYSFAHLSEVFVDGSFESLKVSIGCSEECSEDCSEQ